MVCLGLVGGGWLVGPKGLWDNKEDTDLTFLCRVDGVKVHGLTVLLGPLLPMVREARALQAGEGRINITLEGVASKTLVDVFELLYTGMLNVAEDDTDALFEVFNMLQVSDEITRVKTLTKSAQTNLTKRLKYGENAKTETIPEDFEAGGQKLSGKAKLVEKTRQAREAKKAKEDGYLPSEPTTVRKLPKTKEKGLSDDKKLSENEVLEELGKLVKALEEVYEEDDTKLSDKSENGMDERDEAQGEDAAITVDFPSAVSVENEKTNMVEESEKVINIVRKEQHVCEGPKVKGLETCRVEEETVDIDTSEDEETTGVGMNTDPDKKDKEEQKKTTKEVGKYEDGTQQNKIRVVCESKPVKIRSEASAEILGKEIAEEHGRTEETGQTCGGETDDHNDEQTPASWNTVSTAEMEICLEDQATIGSDMDEKVEKTEEICDENLKTCSAIEESGEDSLKFTKGNQAKDEIPLMENISEKQFFCAQNIQEQYKLTSSKPLKYLKDVQINKEDNIKESFKNSEPSKDAEKKKPETELENPRNTCEEEIMIPGQRVTHPTLLALKGSSCEDKEAEISIEKDKSSVQVAPEITCDVSKDDRQKEDHDDHELKNTDLREEKQLTKFLLNSREETQDSAYDKSVNPDSKSVNPDIIKVSENTEKTEATAENSPRSDSPFFADCGPIEPVSFLEEFSFTNKCDTNKEKDWLDETKSDEEGKNILEKEQICLLKKHPNETDDHGSNKRNILGIQESGSSRCRGTEEEMMPSNILLLHDTRIKTDEGPGQDGSRPQTTEENKHTKDGDNGSTELHKRKHDEETCEEKSFAKKSKTAKLHCRCMQPSSGDEIQCMFCSERYHINCLKLPLVEIEKLSHQTPWICPPCKAEKRRELESTLRRKEAELCQEIEEKMRKKRRRRKMILSLPESMCRLHPPLRLGSKHFCLNLPKPEDEGFFPVDGKGRYSQLGSKEIDRTEKQLRRMKKRERRERRRRHREEKIRRGQTGEEIEEFKSLRSTRDVSCPELDLNQKDPRPLQRPPTPNEKLKKGFGWVLEYVPFGKKMDDIKREMKPSGRKGQSAKLQEIGITSTTSEGPEESPRKIPPAVAERTMTEQVAKKSPTTQPTPDKIPTSVKSPQCNFSLECEVCDVKMKTLSALYSHYASHFTVDLEKKCGDLRDNLRCLICGQSYKSRHILKNHIGVKHGKINDILAEKGFKVLPCPVSMSSEGRKREEMQRSLTAIKKEKEEESHFEEANQSDENKSRLTVDHCGSELVVPDADAEVNPRMDVSVYGQKVGTLIQDPDPVNEEVHQNVSPNKPKGNSDKENNQNAPEELSTRNKQARGPKIVLSKKNSDQRSKEKTEECRYRVETVTEGNIECQNEKRAENERRAAAAENENRATVAESSNRPSLPPLRIKAPSLSFCETLQNIENSEREKKRKKKKRKRVKEEEELGRNIFLPVLSEDEVEIVASNIVQDTPTPLKPGGEDLHFCYECKSIFISKEGLMNHKKSECE